MNTIILQETFTDERNHFVQVTLDKTHLSITSLDGVEKNAIKLKEITGTKCEKPYRTNSVQCSLIMNAFPSFSNELKLTPDGLFNQSKRKKVQFELNFSKFQTINENLEVVQKWHDTLSDQLMVENSSKPFLVFVNPHSGSGKAAKILLKNVFNTWNEVNVSAHVIQTEYEQHARQFVSQISLNKYRAIVVISGDGLIFEVLNGLIERNDWQEAIKLPIAQIPAGSANGLASSVAFLSREGFRNTSLENFSSLMAFCLTKWTAQPMDLISLELASGKFIYSFMNVEWSIVADVDAESERYRFLGEMRFILGALIRIISKLFLFNLSKLYLK